MKLVIELDEVAYDLLTGKIETANIDLFSTLIKSVQNGTPLEEELKNIKTKIISPKLLGEIAEVRGEVFIRKDYISGVIRNYLKENKE